MTITEEDLRDYSLARYTHMLFIVVRARIEFECAWIDDVEFMYPYDDPLNHASKLKASDSIKARS